MTIALYRCPACKRTYKREVTRATRTRRSYCERTGRNVTMALVR